jgi:hypothetical protein
LFYDKCYGNRVIGYKGKFLVSQNQQMTTNFRAEVKEFFLPKSSHEHTLQDSGGRSGSPEIIT